MCKCVTKVLKEKVMLFAKALPCRIKHVLCHISSDQSLSGFSSCNPSESSEHRHQVNQVGEIVHGCHVLRPTVLLQDVKRMISDIVRYPWYPDDPWYPWYPDDPWKSNRCPFFFWKASDDLINSLRRGWFPWSTQSKHRRCLPGDLATLRWVVLAASFYPEPQPSVWQKLVMSGSPEEKQNQVGRHGSHVICWELGDTQFEKLWSFRLSDTPQYQCVDLILWCWIKGSID